MFAEEGPALTVGRLTSTDGDPVGFLAWDYMVATQTVPLRPWPRRRKALIPSIHYQMEMQAGQFAGEWIENFETLVGKPEIFDGRFAYRGVGFCYEELHGNKAAVVLRKHFNAGL